MDVTYQKESEYTPEWNGNRDEKEPVVCTISALTPAQRDQCIFLKYDVDGTHAQNDLGKAVRWGVKSIRNLSVNGIQVQNGIELAGTPGLDELFSELAMRILRGAEKQDLKNS